MIMNKDYTYNEINVYDELMKRVNSSNDGYFAVDIYNGTGSMRYNVRKNNLKIEKVDDLLFISKKGEDQLDCNIFNGFTISIKLSEISVCVREASNFGYWFLIKGNRFRVGFKYVDNK